MHWCAYPSPTHSLIQAKKQQTKSASTVQSLTTCWKTVGVTGKILKWQLEKRAPKVLSSLLLQNASVSHTQKHRWTSMGGWLAIR